MKKWVKNMTPPSSVYSKGSIKIETIYPTVSPQFNQPYYDYHRIYEFILNNIVYSSDLFSSCKMIDEDEEGNPSIEFYINYINDLTYAQRKEVTYKVLEKVYEFCINSGFEDKFHNVSIFLIK